MSEGPIRVGIGGWSFAPWRGSFYPQGLAQTRELEHASRQVSSIEINATFYGSQKPSSFAKWRAATPEGFVFSIKAPRVATNRRDLAESAPSIARFAASGLTELGDKLGPLLWQFPAHRAFDADVFAAFLAGLPREQDGRKLRHAIETQHPSFADPAYMSLLRDHNVAHVVVESGKHPLLTEQTADFAYARLQRNEAGSAEGYDSAALDEWGERVQGWAKAGRECFVYFISGDKERAPDSARAFMKRL